MIYLKKTQKKQGPYTVLVALFKKGSKQCQADSLNIYTIQYGRTRTYVHCTVHRGDPGKRGKKEREREREERK